MNLSPAHLAQFWMLVRKNSSGCWLWTGKLDPDGYGLYKVDDRNHRAHRIAYQFVVGPLDPELEIDHHCRVRNCVNPSHLEQVTQAVNLERRKWDGKRGICKKHGTPHDRQRTYNGKSYGVCSTCARERYRRWKAKQD